MATIQAGVGLLDARWGNLQAAREGWAHTRAAGAVTGQNVESLLREITRAIEDRPAADLRTKP